MRAGEGLLPVWTNFILGLFHRRPRIESSRRQKNFDRAGIFQKQQRWGANLQSEGLQSDTLPLCHAFLMNSSNQTWNIFFLSFSGNLALCVAEWRRINANTTCIGFVFGQWMACIKQFFKYRRLLWRCLFLAICVLLKKLKIKFFGIALSRLLSVKLTICLAN